MKKLFYIVAIIAIVRIAMAVHYDTKLLAEPIPVAGEIDFSGKSLKFSYITNKLEPHLFQSIEIGGHHYYGEQPFSMFDEADSVPMSYADFTYYSVYSPIIWLYEEEDLTPLEGATRGTIHFADGHTAVVELGHRYYEDMPQMQSMLSAVGTVGTSEQFNIMQPFTLDAVHVVDDRVAMKVLKVNSKEIPLPLAEPVALLPGDKLYMETTDGEAHFEMELFTVELHITEEGKKNVLPIREYLNMRPNEEWVKAMVEERGVR